MFRPQKSPKNDMQKSPVVSRNNILGIAIKNILKNATDPATLASIILRDPKFANLDGREILMGISESKGHNVTIRSRAFLNVLGILSDPELLMTCWETASPDMHPFLMLMLSNEPEAMTRRPSFDSVPDIIRHSVMALKISDSGEKSVTFMEHLLNFLDQKLKLPFFSEISANAKDIPFYSSHLLNHFPLQEMIFWAEGEADMAYILCVDISASNAQGCCSSSKWQKGTNALNLVWLVNYILSENPKAHLYVSPWGRATRHPLFQVKDVKRLMSLRCISINDAGTAGILNTFSTVQNQNVQGLFEKLETIRNNLATTNWGHTWLKKDIKKLEDKIIEYLPTNAAWDYSGASLYSQIFDALEQTFDLPEEFNVICIVHTDGLLDALEDPENRTSKRIAANTSDPDHKNFQGYLGQSQLCEKLSKLNFEDKNFSKFVLQFGVHANYDVVCQFSKAFAAVCLQALGHGSATLGIINSAEESHLNYIQEATLNVPLTGFKLKPQLISIVHENRALQVPRARPSQLCQAFENLTVIDEEKVEIMKHICSFLVNRIESIIHCRAEQFFLLEEQFKMGDLGIIYGFVNKMNTELQNKVNITLEWGKEAEPLTLKLLELTSSVSSIVSQIMPRVMNDDRRSLVLQSLIIKAKEDPEKVMSLRIKIKTESINYEPLGYLGIGFKGELPTYYDCTKAASIDCKNASLFSKHLRSYEGEALEGMETMKVFIAKSRPKGYGDFLMAQCQLAFCLLTGDIVLAPSMVFVLACYLLTHKKVGSEAQAIDPILHNLLMELVKHFDASTILPQWKLDTEGFWIFEQNNFQMNPNFWKAVVLASRLQPNLLNEEIENHENFKSRNAHLIETQLQSDGSIKVFKKKMEMTGYGLSFEANRIACQLELYRGLVRLKALQSMCKVNFELESVVYDQIVRPFDITKGTYESMKQNLVSVVPVNSQGHGIWLPKCMYIDGEFVSGPVTNIGHVCVVYSHYTRSLKSYEAGDKTVLVPKASHLNSYGSFLYRNVFIYDDSFIDCSATFDETSGDPTAAKCVYDKVSRQVIFSISFKEILSVFGTSYFGIDPVLLSRVLHGRNPKISREDVREYASYAIQNPVAQTTSIDEMCLHEFKVKTVEGETQKCRLNADQWQAVAKIYSERISHFLSPNLDETGSDVEVFSLCCCCLETMAFHLDGDRKAQKLDCEHLICSSCASEMVSVALNAPLQLVTCPYCRSAVSTKTLDNIGKTNDNLIRNTILYSRLVIQGIPMLLKGPDYCLKLEEKDLQNIIVDGMKMFYFGVCIGCDTVSSIEKQCAGSMPKADMFKCEECLDNETLLMNGDTKCPHCGFIVVRIDGCAFMTCFCGGHFCIHCGCGLKPSEHFSHFNGNPFSKICIGLDTQDS